MIIVINTRNSKMRLVDEKEYEETKHLYKYTRKATKVEQKAFLESGVASGQLVEQKEVKKKTKTKAVEVEPQVVESKPADEEKDTTIQKIVE